MFDPESAYAPSCSIPSPKPNDTDGMSIQLVACILSLVARLRDVPRASRRTALRTQPRRQSPQNRRILNPLLHLLIMPVRSAPRGTREAFSSDRSAAQAAHATRRQGPIRFHSLSVSVRPVRSIHWRKYKLTEDVTLSLRSYDERSHGAGGPIAS